MNFPDELKYTSEHEWVRFTDENTPDGRQIAVVGITDFAQGELGELVYIEVETVGEVLNANEVFGTVEAVKTTSDLLMPVKGKVVEFNAAIDDARGGNPRSPHSSRSPASPHRGDSPQSFIPSHASTPQKIYKTWHMQRTKHNKEKINKIPCVFVI